MPTRYAPPLLIAAILLSLAPPAFVQSQPVSFDLVVRGGRIVDGTGNPWFVADVGIRGDAIVAVAPRLEAAGAASSTPEAASSRPASSTSTPRRTARRQDIFGNPGRGTTCARVSRRSSAARTGAVRFRWRLSRTRNSAQARHQRRRVHRPGLRARRVLGEVEPPRRRPPSSSGCASWWTRACGWRVRAEHRSLLRARQFAPTRRGGGARARGGLPRRHLPVPHARRGGARSRQRPRHHRDRRARRAAHAGHAPQGRRREELGPEHGHAGARSTRRGREASTPRSTSTRTPPRPRASGRRSRRSGLRRAARRRSLRGCATRRTRGSPGRVATPDRDERGGGDPRTGFLRLRVGSALAGKNLAEVAARRAAAGHLQRAAERLSSDRRAGQLQRGLPRDQRRGPRADHESSGDDDRVGGGGMPTSGEDVPHPRATARSRACSASTSARRRC